MALGEQSELPEVGVARCACPSRLRGLACELEFGPTPLPGVEGRLKASLALESSLLRELLGRLVGAALLLLAVVVI